LQWGSLNEVTAANTVVNFPCAFTQRVCYINVSLHDTLQNTNFNSNSWVGTGSITLSSFGVFVEQQNIVYSQNRWWLAIGY
jgi:hypothetical protein